MTGIRFSLVLVLLMGLSACARGHGATASETTDEPMVKGPPMEDIVTDFDHALMCLKGKVPAAVAFGVGAIADTTGKEQYADSGTGKIVSQGAGDMVQSALFRAGVTVVNRRDPNILLAENNWGIRDLHSQIPVDLFVTGSITSLDFIPGGGAQFAIAGIGPKFRQNRILVGLDLALTEATTGKVVANMPIQKQLFEKEVGFDVGRYFHKTLTEVNAGNITREALQFTLRQMLSYATFELIAQTITDGDAQPCRNLIRSMDATTSTPLTHADGSLIRKIVAASDARNAAAAPPPAQDGHMAVAPQQGPTSPLDQMQGSGTAEATSDISVGLGTGGAAPPSGSPATAGDMPAAAKSAAADATLFASRVIADADLAAKATTAADAKKAADDADTNLALAIKALQDGAAAGLGGAEGDAAALVVEQAMKAAKEARRIANAKASSGDQGQSSAPLSATDPKLGGAGGATP